MISGNNLGKNESINSSKGVKLRRFFPKSRPFDDNSDRLESWQSWLSRARSSDRSERRADLGDRCYKNEERDAIFGKITGPHSARPLRVYRLFCVFHDSSLYRAEHNYHVDYNFENRLSRFSATHKLIYIHSIDQVFKTYEMIKNFYIWITMM